MPNYSHNKLIIVKKDSEPSGLEFDKFISDNLINESESENMVLTFEGLMPVPKELMIKTPQYNEDEKEKAEINLKKYGAKDWYDWCVEHWGTKWNAQTNKIKKTNNQISIYFDTAWAPPEPWLDKIAITYPNLEFEFHCSEESGSFDGKGIVKDAKWDWKINRPAKWFTEMEESEKNK